MSGGAVLGRDDRPWLGLLAAAILLHAALGLALPEAGWTTSAGVGGVLLVTLGFCLWQARSSTDEMRWRWRVLACAFASWIAAYAAIAYLQCFATVASPRLQIDNFFYDLRGVPYLLLLARSGDGDEGLAVRRIDSLQALLFSALLMILLFPSLVPGGPASAIMPDAVADHYYEVETVALALLSLVGMIDQPTAARRRFAWGMSALLVSYAASAIPLNRLIIDALDPPPGALTNLVADLPPAILMGMTIAAVPRNADRPARRRPTSLLQLLLPAAFCAASVAAAFAIAARDPAIGMIGAGAALLLKATRSALLQSRISSLQRFIGEVVERLPDALCVVGRDGVVTLGNEAASRLFGTATPGHHLSTLLATVGCDVAAPAADTIEMADGRTLVIAEAPLPAGERIVRFTDVTRIRGIEQGREEALQFLSHDMRSPYAAILALLDTRSAAALADDANAVERIRRYARHGLKMAEDFVQLARARTALIAHHPVDIGDAVAEAADMVWPLARERRITIEGGIDREIWVSGDRAMLVRAIHNLLDNGVKFAPEGSVLDYGLTVERGRAVVCIGSEGPDLPLDRQRSPFARFGSISQGAGAKGTGLGLAFVSAATSRHGGTVRHERAGLRHSFVVEIPLLREETA